MNVTSRQLPSTSWIALPAGAGGEGRYGGKEKLLDYFIAHGYGQQEYSIDEIRQIIKEMDAIDLTYPKDSEAGVTELYVQLLVSLNQVYKLVQRSTGISRGICVDRTRNKPNLQFFQRYSAQHQ